MTAILYNETPIHRDNFIKLAKEGYYDGTLFHRVIKNFMVQGGDPDSRNAKPDQHLGVGGPDYTLQAEFRPEFIHKKALSQQLVRAIRQIPRRDHQDRSFTSFREKR